MTFMYYMSKNEDFGSACLSLGHFQIFYQELCFLNDKC